MSTKKLIEFEFLTYDNDVVAIYVNKSRGFLGTKLHFPTFMQHGVGPEYTTYIESTILLCNSKGSSSSYFGAMTYFQSYRDLNTTAGLPRYSLSKLCIKNTNKRTYICTLKNPLDFIEFTSTLRVLKEYAAKNDVTLIMNTTRNSVDGDHSTPGVPDIFGNYTNRLVLKTGDYSFNIERLEETPLIEASYITAHDTHYAVDYNTLIPETGGKEFSAESNAIIDAIRNSGITTIFYNDGHKDTLDITSNVSVDKEVIGVTTRVSFSTFGTLGGCPTNFYSKPTTVYTKLYFPCITEIASVFSHIYLQKEPCGDIISILGILNFAKDYIPTEVANYWADPFVIDSALLPGTLKDTDEEVIDITDFNIGLRLFMKQMSNLRSIASNHNGGNINFNIEYNAINYNVPNSSIIESYPIKIESTYINSNYVPYSELDYRSSTFINSYTGKVANELAKKKAICITTQKLTKKDVVEILLDLAIITSNYIFVTEIRIEEGMFMEPVLNATKRCKVSDYVFKIGAEFETGVGSLSIAKAASYEAKSGNIVGHCHDGGGLELKSIVLSNPTVFDWYAKFDALCKQVRSIPGYCGTTSASTHMHMSINPSPKVLVEPGAKSKDVNPTWYGDAMFRRKLIMSNWFSLFLKYDLALAFFDTFNRDGRRDSSYGKAYRLMRDNSSKGAYIYTNDARHTNTYRSNLNARYTYVNNPDSKLNSFGRESLLRTQLGFRKTSCIHWEWRGMDACPSALFTGLKVELLQAIARKSIHEALEGNLLEHTIPDYTNLVSNLKHTIDVYDYIARKEAIKMVEELKVWLSPEGYKGLKAWASYVDIRSKDIGTKPWFENMEAILIQAIGISKFLTNATLNKAYQKATGTYIPVSYDKDKELKSKFKEVITKDLLTHNISVYSGTDFSSRSPFVTTNTCSSCGNYCSCVWNLNKYICKTCLESESYLNSKGNQQFIPRKNLSEKSRRKIVELVSTPLEGNRG